MGRFLQNLAVPLAMLACLVALASALKDPESAAETGYLAVLATAVLLPLFCLPGRTRWGAEAAAVLVTTVAWTLPAGATRGAAVGLLLTACLALELYHRLGREEGELPWSFALPAALALQMLFRSDRLLAPDADPRVLVGLMVLPLVGAAAAVLLWPRFGARVAVAVAALVVLAPGWRVAPVLTLAALAAAAWLPAARRPATVALLAILVAAAFWRPPFAVLLALAVALALTAGRPRLQAIVGGAALVAALPPLAPVGWQSVPEVLARLLLVLPAALVAGRGGWLPVASALLLALAGSRWLSEEIAALAPAAALLALGLGMSGPAWTLQRLWSALLVPGCALLAAYPWLRADPLPAALALTGLAPDWPAALALTAAVAAGAALVALGSRRWPRLGRSTAALGWMAIAFGLFVSLPPRGSLPLRGKVFVLDADHPVREAEFEAQGPVSKLVLDSYLSQGVKVPAGVEVARVTLFGEGDERLEWSLRSVVDTGEWAARRPDVTALPGFSAPEPWLSWVVPGGFFAQRYRTVRPAEGSLTARRVRIALAEDLPTDVSLAVFHLELRP